MEFYGRVPLYHKNNLTRTHRKNQNIMLREEAMFLQSVAETFRLLYLKKKKQLFKTNFYQQKYYNSSGGNFTTFQVVYQRKCNSTVVPQLNKFL